MKRRVLKKLVIFTAAVVTAIILMVLFEARLDRKIDSMYDVSAYTKPMNLTYDDYTKDKGQLILEKSAENDNLILMGSSELNSWAEQNPIHMFPNTTYDKNLTAVGQAYVQSLLHAMKAGTPALSDEKQLCLVVSLQWFMGDDIDVNGFAANFSEYQFYEFMKNERLSRESKQYICNRTKELLTGIEGYDDIKVYVWLYTRDNIFGKAGLTILKPYYMFREKILELKDKWDTSLLLEKLEEEAQKPEVRNMDWEEEWEKAEAAGAYYCTNNDFYVEDGYYDTYLRETIQDLEGVEAETRLESREMEDFEMFLQICRENGVEPYVIIMNTNGYYYDYVGLDKERRDALYDEIERRARDQGVSCLNLSDKEYEPYFMLDVMHLGWKGWLYVDRQIAEHFAEGEGK